MEVCQGNMLKVCHFTSVHDAKDRRIFSKECCSLAKLGFKVFIVAPNAVSEIIHDVQIIGVPVANDNRLYRYRPRFCPEGRLRNNMVWKSR